MTNIEKADEVRKMVQEGTNFKDALEIVKGLDTDQSNQDPKENILKDSIANNIVLSKHFKSKANKLTKLALTTNNIKVEVSNTSIYVWLHTQCSCDFRNICFDIGCSDEQINKQFDEAFKFVMDAKRGNLNEQ